jgi:23S rRNA (cytidine1920-2'-O)/16S rRNA (cytidine1409-2'-O)-methyltransferase
MEKVRLDRLVVTKGLTSTREKARRLVLAGEVLVNDRPVEKPGTLVDSQSRLRLRHPPSPFVSRGGEKLAGVIAQVGLDVEGLQVLDVGASTGGFTDCLLQKGASQVTALDVGKAQLDWKLRSDPRVKVVEGVNARYLHHEDFPDGFDLVTVDVSFISLSKILPAVTPLVRPGGKLLALVKPQFELSRKDVETGGVVRDPHKHLRAILSVCKSVESCGLAVKNLIASAIKGVEGNQEFFLLMSRDGTGKLDEDGLVLRAREVCGLEY